MGEVSPNVSVMDLFRPVVERPTNLDRAMLWSQACEVSYLLSAKAAGRECVKRLEEIRKAKNESAAAE